MFRYELRRTVLVLMSFILGGMASPSVSLSQDSAEPQRLLYVAAPGIRNYLEYGGHGLLVFDVDNGHKFVRRIPRSHSLNRVTQNRGRLIIDEYRARGSSSAA